MKAVVCHNWGTPDTLTVEDVPTPEPGAGQVRVRVRAVGLNFADTLIIQGQYQLKPELPFSPGMEFAGDVVAVGDGVKNLRVGDAVMGIVDYGAFAEEVIADSRTLIPKPDAMDYKTAAAFPIAYGTSHLALSHRAGLQPHETLLVLGAAGGTGLTAVEIGKHMGATVIAAASKPEKLELTRRYGADHTINYRKESIRDRVKALTDGKGADVIFDPVGGDAFHEALRAINWEGRLLVIGFASGQIPQVKANLTLVKNCAIVGVFWGAYARRDPATLTNSLMTLIGWHERGSLKPHISTSYPLEQTGAAMQELIERRATGKIIVTVG